MKKVIFLIEIIIIVCLIAVALVMFVPNAKPKFVKSFLGCSLGKGITGCFIGDEYESYIQDKEFHESNILTNEGLVIPEEYTNIALFGGDVNGDKENGLLGEGSHSDSIIILSINKTTGEMKMVSVYRDTYLQYTAEDVNYGKATNAMFFGGPISSVNMLNKNLDLNIKDYIVINYSGLANIIDELGGINVSITSDELSHINAILADNRIKTGIDSPDVTTYGEVQLTGLQAVAYCRIRYVTFTDSAGIQFINDFGRTERQKHVLKLTLQKMKDSGISELINVSKNLFKENTEENKFITTSMTLDETLDIVSAAMELNMPTTSGFPIERGSATIGGQDCIIPKSLESNVVLLHEYLFGTKDYVTTDELFNLSRTIIDKTGIE